MFPVNQQSATFCICHFLVGRQLFIQNINSVVGFELTGLNCRYYRSLQVISSSIFSATQDSDLLYGSFSFF